jgi:hypothetical protein
MLTLMPSNNGRLNSSSSTPPIFNMGAVQSNANDNLATQATKIIWSICSVNNSRPIEESLLYNDDRTLNQLRGNPFYMR